MHFLIHAEASPCSWVYKISFVCYLGSWSRRQKPGAQSKTPTSCVTGVSLGYTLAHSQSLKCHGGRVNLRARGAQGRASQQQDKGNCQTGIWGIRVGMQQSKLHKVCGIERAHLLHIYLAHSTRRLLVALQQNGFTVLDATAVWGHSGGCWRVERKNEG